MIINHNMSAIFADRALSVSTTRQTRTWRSSPRACASSARATTLPGSPSRRRCAARSAACARPARTPRTASPSSRPRKATSRRARTSCRGCASSPCRRQTASTPTRTACRSRWRSRQLVDEVDRIASHAQFNGMNMLTGRFARANGQNVVTASMWLQIGANMDQRTRVFIGTMTAEALGIRNAGNKQIISLCTPDGANRSIGIAGLRRCEHQQAAGRPGRLPEPPGVRGEGVGRRGGEPAGRQSRGSATPTWPPRWWSTPRTPSWCRRAPRCSPRQTKEAIGLAAAPVA